MPRETTGSSVTGPEVRPAERLTVHKCDHAGRVVTSYPGTVVACGQVQIAVRTEWTSETCDVGMFVFENGDHLLETFFFALWWNVFELHRADGRLRGWYCNIARPARLAGHDLYWDDLALDLLIAPTGQFQVRDEDEFRALRLEEREPQAHAEALRAVAHIRSLVAQALPPFEALSGS
ncbi:MAG TPA: DUF402 domain-containing protein [Anaerolineae bacterium]|nr:DUF402 domain-containing protein [Anaerolineae bacterium]HPL26644.1 DUF402 domain-containing protein [Anaerolineae bacterium]